MNEYKESQSSLYSPLSHFFSPLPPSQSKVSRHFMDLQLLPDVLNQFICQSQFEIYKNVYLYTIQTFGTHISIYLYGPYVQEIRCRGDAKREKNMLRYKNLNKFYIKIR